MNCVTLKSLWIIILNKLFFKLDNRKKNMWAGPTPSKYMWAGPTQRKKEKYNYKVIYINKNKCDNKSNNNERG